MRAAGRRLSLGITDNSDRIRNQAEAMSMAVITEIKQLMRQMDLMSMWVGGRLSILPILVMFIVLISGTGRADNEQQGTAVLEERFFKIKHIVINGDYISIPSGYSCRYTCIATGEDGSTSVVQATWSLSGDDMYAVIDLKGVLTNKNNTKEDKKVTLMASYNGETISKALTLKALQPDSTSVGNELVDIEIRGEDIIPLGGSRAYTCNVVWNNGQKIMENATFSLADPIDRKFVKLSKGIVTNYNITDQDKSITLKVTFGEITKEKTITLKKLDEKKLSSLYKRNSSFRKILDDFECKIEDFRESQCPREFSHRMPLVGGNGQYCYIRGETGDIKAFNLADDLHKRLKKLKRKVEKAGPVTRENYLKMKIEINRWNEDYDSIKKDANNKLRKYGWEKSD